MSQASTVNITIEQGEDFNFSFSYTDLTGVPIDLTGATASMMIRADLDSVPAVTLTTANGRISWEPATGIFTIRIPAAETLRMALEDGGVHDLFIKASDGMVEKLITGTTTFIRAVTR